MLTERNLPSRWMVCIATVLIALFLGPAPVQAAESRLERKGRLLYAEGDYQGALEIFANLFADTGDPLLLRNIGRCNQKLRRPDKAIEAFRDYLQRGRNIKPAERQEIEGYVKEMEALRASQEREARAAAPPEPSPPPPAAAPPPTPSPRAASEPIEPVPVPQPRPVEPPERPRPTAGPPAGSPEDNGRQLGAGKIFVALAVGTGVGIATGTADLNPSHTLGTDGFAPAQLGHVAPEVGVFLTPHLLLSTQLRLQLVTGLSSEYLTDVCGPGERYCTPSPLALAGFARLAWVTGNGSFHALAGVAVGGGTIKHAKVFTLDGHCGSGRDKTCVDTLSAGPFLFGPFLGLLVDLSPSVGIELSVNTLVGVPHFTLNFDFNLGLAFRL